MTIKILHRIYFGFDGQPDPYIGYLKTWQEQLPEYKICHWNSSNLPVDACYFSSLMFQLKDHAFLSDYFRWWILREHGGIYLDADIEIVDGRRFNKLIENLECSVEEHALIGIDNKEGGWYTAHSIAAKKGGDLPCFMCEVYENMGPLALWRRKIFYLMAPQLTSLYFAKKGWNPDGMGSSPNLNEPVSRFGVRILPQEYFSPLTPAQINGVAGFKIDSHTQETCLCHHFSCSWHNTDSPYRLASKALQNNPKLADLVLQGIYASSDKKQPPLKAYRMYRILKSFLALGLRVPKIISQIIKDS